MILPPDPTQFLAHGKAHKTLTQSQPCQELKMPTPHAHPPPSGRILFGLTLYINRRTIINTSAK
jgi:hypothetical protein